MTANQTPEAADLEPGRYFRYMAEFVGFTEPDKAVIKDTRFIIEKHIPAIVSQFYEHLLAYPPTRKFFLKKDGTIDQEYLQLRMHHLTNFWRRTASSELDNDYARYVDYVGRAHTASGADPKIYIPERYVIGQVGFVQHAISEILHEELQEIDADLAQRASRAWNLLLMVILEMLSRAYSGEHEAEDQAPEVEVDPEKVRQLAVETYERNLDLYRSIEHREVVVAREEEIPEGERKIVEIDGLSVGIFRHQGSWYAVRNYCLHRAGPVCTGSLEGNTLTCPWHGYQYDLTTGTLLIDPTAALEMYPVEAREGEVRVRFPRKTWDTEPVTLDSPAFEISETTPLQLNEFRLDRLGPGQIVRVRLDGAWVAVYNLDGAYYATADTCTHEGGSLSAGHLDGSCVACPLHNSCFDVRDGSVVRGPAEEPVQTFQVAVEGEIGRVLHPDA